MNKEDYMQRHFSNCFKKIVLMTFLGSALACSKSNDSDVNFLGKASWMRQNKIENPIATEINAVCKNNMLKNAKRSTFQGHLGHPSDGIDSHTFRGGVIKGEGSGVYIAHTFDVEAGKTYSLESWSWSARDIYSNLPYYVWVQDASLLLESGNNVGALHTSYYPCPIVFKANRSGRMAVVVAATDLQVNLDDAETAKKPYELELFEQP